MGKNIKKMICFIEDYIFWDDTIHEHTVKFHNRYSIYPNIMQAGKETWKQIDHYANMFHPERIEWDDENSPEEMAETDAEPEDEEIKSLSGFATLDYSLEFCIEESVKEKYFILLYDGNPIFDGEPYDAEDMEEVTIYKRIA